MEGEIADTETFRRTLTDLAVRAAQDSSPQEVLIAAGQAASTINEYGRQTTQFFKAQTNELQSMVAMALTRTMSQISTSSEQSISHLQEIERTLACAAVIDDLRTLKIRMSECLETVRTECMRQKQESTKRSGSARRPVPSSGARIRIPAAARSPHRLVLPSGRRNGVKTCGIQREACICGHLRGGSHSRYYPSIRPSSGRQSHAGLLREVDLRDRSGGPAFPLGRYLFLRNPGAAARSRDHTPRAEPALSSEIEPRL